MSAQTLSLGLPQEFKPVCQYVMRNGRPDDVQILDEFLWNQSGVVYVRMYGEKVVYIGVTDGLLSKRIRAHLHGISAARPGTASRRYLDWAEGKQITIAAYRPEPVHVLGRTIKIHRSIEAALIAEFQQPSRELTSSGGPDCWFVART